MPFWAPLVASATAATGAGGAGGGGGLPPINLSSRSGDITAPLDFSFDKQFAPAPPGGSSVGAITTLIVVVGLVFVARALKG